MGDSVGYFLGEEVRRWLWLLRRFGPGMEIGVVVRVAACVSRCEDCEQWCKGGGWGLGVKSAVCLFEALRCYFLWIVQQRFEI
jgi:hypothetical protein